MKHIVGFSGGADSQACAGWVLDHFPKEDVILCNSDAGGNEHPLTTEHIKWYSENVHPVVMIKPLVKDLGGAGARSDEVKQRRESLGGDDKELSFGDLAFIKNRFPSRKAQFCTEYLKLIPQKRWLDENLADQAYTRYVGVRADESAARRDLPEKQWDDYFDCDLVRPILSWTKEQIFDYIKSRGEKVNPLYLMGFGRVGCAPCINSSKEDILNWATRFPEMIDKVRQWEKQVGRSFFPPNLVPGVQVAFVDEIVAWSKTSHGGKKIPLPFFQAEAESGSCVSKYGLCE